MSKVKSLIIKACTTVVPGFGKAGAPYGQLLKTSDLLTRSLSLAQQKIEGGGNFDPHFIAKKIGVKTVACSNSTLEVCQKLWDNPEKYTSQTAYALSQSTPNVALYKALESSVASAIAIAKDGVLDAQFKISAHIHIVTYTALNVEYELYAIRKRLNISPDRPMSTIILQQGCSGILPALQFAESLIASFSDKEKQNILITSENNMMSGAHQRFPLMERPNGINSWLWGIIFGEGVGAMVVSGSEKNLSAKNVAWGVDSLQSEIIENNWRVCPEVQDGGYKTISIRAREVSETYMRGVSKHAKIAIDSAGGLKDIFRVCFHESNPMLLEKVRKEAGVPSGLVPTLSADIGTLACVSSFTLLEKATQEFQKNSDNDSSNKLVFGIIGEACGRVDVGHMVLSPVGMFTRKHSKQSESSKEGLGLKNTLQ